ncbi:MAG: DUF2281 domain-containing protein [Candidatus Bipolaricaulota bacterium]
MKVRDQLLRRIEGLPEDVLEEVNDFVAFIQQKRQEGGEELSWGSFALSTRSFQFWSHREEVEYSLDDLRPEA